MTLPFRYNSPEEQFAAQIASLQKQIQDLQQRPFQIPVLDDDPAADYQGNAWMLNDGRLHIRNGQGVIKEYAPITTTGGTTVTPKPPPAPVTKTYTTEWTATWSQTYRQSGAQRTDNNHLYQGYADSFNGRQKGVFGFNYSAIQTALSGAAISKVEVWLSMIHTWNNSGATIYFSGHNETSAPSTYSGVGIIMSRTNSGTFPNTGSKWLTVSNNFGSGFRGGTIKGFVLDPTSDSTSQYAYAGGVSDSYSAPKLRITYVK